MKLRTVILLSLIIFSVSFAQSEKYIKAMEKNLSLMDSAKNSADWISIGNSFERIANTEKKLWLPNYYAAQCFIVASFIDSIPATKDLLLDRAEKFVLTADSLDPDNSEICTLNGFLAQARMTVDPMSRWQKYGQLSNVLFQKAKELDPLNPRPDMLIGNTLYYTPEAFGGGKKTAEPVLRLALDKYQKFVPESSISPKWGREIVEQLLKTIDQDSTK